MKQLLCVVAWLALICFGAGNVSLSPARADGGASKTSARIALVGPAIAGRRPEGHAEFRTEGALRRLNVEVEKVNLADGTQLAVNVNGTTVGMMKLALGFGKIELNSKNGAAVPAIKAGDVVTVVALPSQTTILSGTF